MVCPLSPLAPLSGRPPLFSTTPKPTETQVLRVHYRKPGAGPSGSLLGHAGLRGHPSHGGKPLAPLVDCRWVRQACHAISACIASQGTPCQCPLACPGPFRLLAPGRRWPLAQCPISSGVQGGGGRRLGPAGAGQDPAEREGLLGAGGSPRVLGFWGSGGRLRVVRLRPSLAWRTHARRGQQSLLQTRALPRARPFGSGLSLGCRRGGSYWRGQGPPSAGGWGEGAAGTERVT